MKTSRKQLQKRHAEALKSRLDRERRQAPQRDSCKPTTLRCSLYYCGTESSEALSEVDQAILKTLQSEFGKELVLNYDTLSRAGELLAPRYDAAQEKLKLTYNL